MKKILALILCAVLLVPCLVSCTGIKPSDEDKGAEIPVHLSTEIYNLDPAYAYLDDAAAKILPLIYEGLFKFDEDGKVVKALCTDYETYRSGKFVPGMIGTLFSFIDKLLSSLSGLIAGIALTLAGVGNTTIVPNQPVGGDFDTVILLCFCGVPILGHIASLIAMKFYELDGTRMEEIQSELERRKYKC